MVNIRTARKTDLNECAKLSKLSELQIDERKYPDKKYLSEFLGSLFVVAEDNKKVIGYALGEKEKYKVVSLNILVVDKKFRGRGIGKLLLNEFIKRAKELGLKELYTFVPKWNEKTMNFYKNNKFYDMKYYAYFTKKI